MYVQLLSSDEWDSRGSLTKSSRWTVVITQGLETAEKIGVEPLGPLRRFLEFVPKVASAPVIPHDEVLERDLFFEADSFVVVVEIRGGIQDRIHVMLQFGVKIF